jgi:hypothetical protein
MTNLENLLIYLRNDSGSNITFGSTVITPSESELIWDSVNFTTQPFNAFNNVLNNMSVFNQNIFQSNLIMVNGVTDLTAQEAFDLFLQLRDGYTNYNSELFTLYDKSNFEIIQFGQTILENGLEVASRPKLNFIEGSGANLTILDDPVNNEVDLTISLNIPSLDGYVQTSRTITAGSGLSGGGDLSQNRTISIQQGLLDGYIQGVHLSTNDINLSGAYHKINFANGSGISISGSGTPPNHSDITIGLQSGLLDGYALRTRNINTGVGLTGGGNLTTDRTISIQPGFLDGYSRNTSLDGYVPTSRTITAGTGLTGGGTLAANRTISLQPGLLDGYARFNNLDGYATVTFVNTQDNIIRTALDGYARNTITISAGSGLSGGGNLTTNRTISLQSGLLDGYALSSTVTSLTNNLQAQVNFVEDTLDGYALRIRNINTGIGLTGGGNLISDRTISIAPGFLDGYSRNTSLDGYVPITRIIATGSGLTGGGNLTANRTISLQPGLLDGYSLTSTVTSLTNNLQAQINFVEDTLDGYIEGITVRRNTGSNIGTQPRINFIEGSGVNLTITNDSGNSEIDVIIASSGGSGSGNVIGPESSTDSAIALFDGYDGYIIKNSFATISSIGVLTLDVQAPTAAIILSEDAKGELIEGLNSELLDGQDGSFYTNASNLNSGTLNPARFNDTSHGSRGGGSLHSNATISSAGFMSGTDKAKLNAINLDGYATRQDIDGYIEGITVRRNTGSNVGTQPRLNFIEGSNITISAANDSGNNEIDVTISSSGGSSSSDGSVTNRYPFTWTGSSILITVDVAADFGFTEGTFQVETRHFLQEDGYGDVYWYQGLTGLRYDGTSTLESRPNFFPSSSSWSSAGPTDAMLMDVTGATTVRFTVGVDAGFPTPASGVLYVRIIPLQI